MNNILAFDCSSNDLHLYLRKKDEEYFEIRNIGLKHSERLLPLIHSLMKEAELTPMDLDLIACAKGPGSFTGLRIAMATAKGISCATQKPLVSILTPDYLIAGVPSDILSIVLIDAKKKRYYGRIYKNGTPLSEPLDIAPMDLANKILTIAPDEKAILITGPDALKGKEELESAFKEMKQKIDLQVDPLFRASRIGFLAQMAVDQYNEKGSDSEGSGPFYIRRSEAEEALANRLSL